MEILRISLTAFSSIVVLFILTKMMGNRQMSQLSMFDYINGITIGSIASEMAIASKEDILSPLVSMIVYAVVSIVISLINCKSIKFRRIITGKSVILLENGKLYNKNLMKSKLDINEFLTQCRNNGYFDLSDIEAAILESNGRISFLPVSTQRPVTPSDLNLNPTQERPVANVIIDGDILKQNLRHTGNNETWLQDQLRQQGVKQMSDVFLATCDSNNKLNVYVKIEDKNKMDIFE